LRPELLMRSKPSAVVIVLVECCQEFCAEATEKSCAGMSADAASAAGRTLAGSNVLRQ
jgi:hypothetical protein